MNGSPLFQTSMTSSDPAHLDDPNDPALRSDRIERLYRGRKGRIDLVDVPELGYLVVGGHGAPGGDAFQAAFSTIFPVAYAAHFAARRERGVRTPLMPPEALYWADDPNPRALDTTPMEQWRWAVMVMQPDPIDDLIIEFAMEHARAKSVANLEALRYERWSEGLCLQTVHVGPYDAEGPAITALASAAADADLVPHGRHHEIYLGDPARTAPERLRTIIRQPVAARANGETP